MLGHLQIRDFAIIDKVELELGAGLTVLTGETGAGKSILVDALGLVLGDRADSSAVRHGARRAEITASFTFEPDHPAARFVEEQALDADDECILRRVIGADGRSRAFVNGQTVTLQTLRELGERLVDIHGQHEHQSLTRRGVQRQILDHHGAHATLLGDVATAHGRWQELSERLERLASQQQERAERLELLQYQVDELEALRARAGEYAELEAEHLRLANAGRLGEAAHAALDLAYENEEGAAQLGLTRARQLLDCAVPLDRRLEEPRQRLDQALIEIREAADSLHSYVTDIELDPVRLEAVETRLGALQAAARKHRVEADELPDKLAALAAELAALQVEEDSLDGLSEALREADASYLAAATALSEARRDAAARLSSDVSTLMQELGMPGGRFEVALETPELPRYTAHGIDRVEFLAAANPGQPALPLGKVASGGELSRISLAIQVVAAGATQISSLVFDEVDAGIGGGVAEIVGRRLRSLGAGRQVLCVTHLPQVAGQSHQHVRVSKLTDGRTSRTTLQRLTEHERVEELARMLGGIEITERTRAHAAEMLARAGEA